MLTPAALCLESQTPLVGTEPLLCVLCSAREGIIDAMCTMASGLEGQMPEILSRVNSGGHSLMQDLASFLCGARELDWVKASHLPPLPFLLLLLVLGTPLWAQRLRPVATCARITQAPCTPGLLDCAAVHADVHVRPSSSPSPCGYTCADVCVVVCVTVGGPHRQTSLSERLTVACDVQTMAAEFAARPKMACNNPQAQEVFVYVLALPAYEDHDLLQIFRVRPA